MLLPRTGVLASKAQAGGWVPEDIPELLWYYDTKDDTNFSDASLVSSISDTRAGSLITPSATGTQRPIYDADGLSGEPSIYFDTGDDNLTSATALLAEGNTLFTAAVLLQTATTSRIIPFWHGPGTSSRTPHLIMINGDDFELDLGGNDDVTTSITTVAGGNYTNTPVVLLGGYDGTNLFVYMSDGINKQGATEARASINLAAGNFIINRHQSSEDFHLGAMAVFTKALSGSEQDELIAYWKARYNF